MKDLENGKLHKHIFQFDEPLVSVVIPTYNSSATLETCLDSIKRQVYKNIEVIIVDNFSKDSTINIGQKFGFKSIPDP